MGTPGWSSARRPPLGPLVTTPAVPTELDLWGEPRCALLDLVFSFPTSFLNLGRKNKGCASAGNLWAGGAHQNSQLLDTAVPDLTPEDLAVPEIGVCSSKGTTTNATQNIFSMRDILFASLNGHSGTKVYDDLSSPSFCHGLCIHTRLYAVLCIFTFTIFF